MILVTGAAGNVGREVVRPLLEDGDDVAAVTFDGWASDRAPAPGGREGHDGGRPAAGGRDRTEGIRQPKGEV